MKRPDQRYPPPLTAQSLGRECTLPKPGFLTPERRRQMVRNGAIQKAGHALAHDSRCAVCAHSEIDHIEHGYLRWIPIPDLAADYRLDPADLEWHMKGVQLQKQRESKSGRIKALMRVAEAGIVNLDKAPPRASDAIAALALVAKLKGELVDKIEHTGPRTIILNNIPAPGGLRRQTEEEREALEPEKVPLMVPGKVLESTDEKR